MNLKFVTNAVTSNVVRQALKVRKHSPVLMLAVGVSGMVTTAVMASKATLKLDEVLAEGQKELEIVDKAAEKLDEQEAKQAGLGVRVRTAIRVAKLYAPAIAIGAISVAALTGSHIVLTKRNAGLTAAYALLDKGFKEYRGRVVEELGESKDQEFRHGLVDKEIVEETENGPVVKTVKAVDKIKGASIYAVFFDESSRRWKKDAAYNMMLIDSIQNHMNDLLQARGHLFLNEVYDALGLDRTPAGSVVGWIKGAKDDCVDFGLFTRRDLDRTQDFVNGDEWSVMLDFNVDGVIYDKI